MTANKYILLRISHELRNQDNACTSYPMYVVEQRRRIYGMDPAYSSGDDVAWVDEESIEADPEEHSRLEELYEEEGVDYEDPWTRVCYIDSWEFVTVCLTRKGCEDYIEANRHRLKDPRIFVHSGYRNQEWLALREFFLKDFDK